MSNDEDKYQIDNEIVYVAWWNEKYNENAKEPVC